MHKSIRQAIKFLEPVNELLAGGFQKESERMRARQRDNLQTALRTLRENRRASTADRRNILKVLRNDQMQEELYRRLGAMGIDVDSLIKLLDALMERAPAILKIIGDIIAMFS